LLLGCSNAADLVPANVRHDFESSKGSKNMRALRNFAVAMLSAGGAVTPLAASASTFTTLYTFTGGKDGGNPFGPLLYQHGAFYGTAHAGSDADKANGTVFKIDVKTARFKVVYAFQGAPDGSGPGSGVIYQDGMLYGTTYFGGAGCSPGGCGTIFSIDEKTGAESVLYDFPASNGGPDGSVLPGQVIDVAGTLYGITQYGGANNAGSFFSLNPSTGTFAMLTSFAGVNGVNPNLQLLYQSGLVYGTTMYGGEGACFLGGCGVLFSIVPATGGETVVRSFAKKDGKYPNSNLAYDAGSLFGDTFVGGNQSCTHGCGVSYKIKAASGREKVLEDFQNRGEEYSGISIVGGNAYETLPSGGNGYGELLKVNLKSGQQTVLYTFTGDADGASPEAALTYHDGAFYGTTMSGGGNRSCAGDYGCGTVFKFVP
jgi:uncharacterized repeat protein (TIGR03803 family)